MMDRDLAEKGEKESKKEAIPQDGWMDVVCVTSEVRGYNNMS
jgi:hypothetical protein